MGEVVLKPAICPRCGASLNIPADMDRAHCLYCGTQILVRGSGPDAVECKVCEGFGRVDFCLACCGTGRCTWHASMPVYGPNGAAWYASSSSHCVDGRCAACGGSGRGSPFGPCPFCGGTGRCPRCLGNAKCIACRGLGFIAGPSGSSMCPGCGGKGHLRGDPPKMKEVDICPECGAAMAPDTYFCSRCGFVRGCPRCRAAWPKSSPLCPWCGFKKGAKV
jgi:ribosomal protein S27AE